ncbi:ABC transporter ATP-binding protein [bacterium]|nr:ABC transporter ATP-binding protein [bacterium]
MIEVRDLRLNYSTKEEVLKVIDIPHWSVDKGEHIAIFGPSGSGKSTLLHLLAGVLVPSSGEVTVCGEEVTKMSEAQRDQFRARRIGYVFQNFNLLQGYSALDNVLMGMTFCSVKADRKVAKDLLEHVGIGSRLNHTPSEMSLGEQQRVAIARALAKKPEVVLADEPTGSLDPKNKMQVVDLLRSMCAELGSTLILVSHEENVIDRFEKKVRFADINKAYDAEVAK